MYAPNLETLEGIHVLILDEDEPARDFARAVLELWGAAVTTAATVADAHRAAAVTADVIVCDLATAERAARGFLERLRWLHSRRGRAAPAIALVPVWVMCEARARTPGFERYLSKPVDGDELREAVRALARE